MGREMGEREVDNLYGKRDGGEGQACGEGGSKG